MKIINLFITGALLISIGSFAQKDEIKTLKKIYVKDDVSASDIETYTASATKLSLIAAVDTDVIAATFFKAIIPKLEITALGTAATPIQISTILSAKKVIALVDGLNETLDFEKKLGKKTFTDEIVKFTPQLKALLVNYAVFLGDQKKYKESSVVLYSVYKLDSKDAEKLYYAANYAINGEDFDASLKYYQELKAIKYSGEGTLFFALNKEKNKEESFTNKQERDIYIKAGTHTNPRDEKIPSKRGEIYKNIALILVQNGKTAEAKTAISEARTENPDDITLVLTEADLYYKLGDMETYKILINRAIEKNPNDATLVFNLGVVSANTKQLKEAEKFYRRAFEIDPNYVDAYINLSEILLRGDEPIFQELNKLGTSDKDNKRYEVLSAQRKAIFNSIVPLLEKALLIKEDNVAAQKTLLSMYKVLEMTDKAKELKAKIKQ